MSTHHDDPFRASIAETMTHDDEHPHDPLPPARGGLLDDDGEHLARGLWAVARVEADRYGVHVEEFVDLRGLVEAADHYRSMVRRYDLACTEGRSEEELARLAADVELARQLLTRAAENLVVTRTDLADRNTNPQERNA